MKNHKEDGNKPNQGQSMSHNSNAKDGKDGRDTNGKDGKHLKDGVQAKDGRMEDEDTKYTGNGKQDSRSKTDGVDVEGRSNWEQFIARAKNAWDELMDDEFKTQFMGKAKKAWDGLADDEFKGQLMQQAKKAWGAFISDPDLSRSREESPGSRDRNGTMDTSRDSVRDGKSSPIGAQGNRAQADGGWGETPDQEKTVKQPMASSPMSRE